MDLNPQLSLVRPALSLIVSFFSASGYLSIFVACFTYAAARS